LWAQFRLGSGWIGTEDELPQLRGIRGLFSDRDKRNLRRLLWKFSGLAAYQGIGNGHLEYGFRAR